MAKKTSVIMLTDIAGSGRDDYLQSGKTYDVATPYAERLIEREQAEAAPVEKSKRETATKQTRETATQPTPEPR